MGTTTRDDIASGPALGARDGLQAHPYSCALWEWARRTIDCTGVQRAQTETSLRRLETNCLDALLFQAWCPTWSEETTWYETMFKLREQGKIRTFGISVSDHRPDDANGVIQAGLVDIIEAPFSILDQQAVERLFPLAQEYAVSIIARTPLASGALAGHWHEGMKFYHDDWRRRVFLGELLTQIVQRVNQVKSLVDTTEPLAQKRFASA